MVREAKLKLGINNLLHGFYFALGIVRVQYQFFMGTGAKRRPAKPVPIPIFSSGLGNVQISWKLKLLALVFQLYPYGLRMTPRLKY